MVDKRRKVSPMINSLCLANVGTGTQESPRTAFSSGHFFLVRASEVLLFFYVGVDGAISGALVWPVYI